MKKVSFIAVIVIASLFASGCKPELKPPSNLNKDQLAGWKIYQAKHCANCHAIKNIGGKIGPDLTKVAAKRDETYLRKLLENSRSVNPAAKMPQSRLSDEQIKSLSAYLKTLK
jgi:mono/diheme cytochrome c family protein